MLTSRAKRLREKALAIRVFGYQSHTQLDIDSFLNFLNMVELEVRIFVWLTRSAVIHFCFLLQFCTACVYLSCLVFCFVLFLYRVLKFQMFVFDKNFFIFQAEIFTIPVKPRYLWGLLIFSIQILILVFQTGRVVGESRWLWSSCKRLQVSFLQLTFRKLHRLTPQSFAGIIGIWLDSFGFILVHFSVELTAVVRSEVLQLRNSS